MYSLRTSADRAPSLSACAAVLAACALAPATAQTTTRLSETPGGAGGDEQAWEPRVSGDGSVAVFRSWAHNLGAHGNPAPLITNNLFRWDAGSGLTALTNFDDDEGEHGQRPVVSADGSWIAFESTAKLTGTTHGGPSVFVTQIGASFVQLTIPVWSIPSGVGACTNPVISSGGRHVAFECNAATLVPEGIDNNGRTDVYVVDRDPDGNAVFDEGNSITTLVSATPAGTTGDGHSTKPTLSGDGRYIAFHSESSDLIAAPIGVPFCTYLLDRDPDGNGNLYDVPGVVTQLNLDAVGASLGPVDRQELSSDASAVVMQVTIAGKSQIQVKDLTTGAVELVSKSSSSLGIPGDANSTWPCISADGQRVAFLSLASNLVWNNSTGVFDEHVYLHDRATGQTSRVSVDSAGHPGDDTTGLSALELYPLDLSADGSTVVFTSLAQNLVPADVNGVGDVFRHAVAGNPTTDHGLATAGGAGLFPAFTVVGALGSGQVAEARLRNAAPGATAILQAGLVPAPTPVGACGAILAMPFPAPITLTFPVDPLGDVTFGFPGGGGPVDFFVQWGVLDPAATCGFGLSNVLQVHFQP